MGRNQGLSLSRYCKLQCRVKEFGALAFADAQGTTKTTCLVMANFHCPDLNVHNCMIWAVIYK
jgi:hypothetical protein